jgi:hypothetical protein
MANRANETQELNALGMRCENIDFSVKKRMAFDAKNGDFLDRTSPENF